MEEALWLVPAFLPACTHGWRVSSALANLWNQYPGPAALSPRQAERHQDKDRLGAAAVRPRGPGVEDESWELPDLEGRGAGVGVGKIERTNYWASALGHAWAGVYVRCFGGGGEVVSECGGQISMSTSAGLGVSLDEGCSYWTARQAGSRTT